MSDQPQPRVIPRTAGQSVWWSRESVMTVKLDAETSGGSLAFGEQFCPPGYETPLHVHADHDEVLIHREGAIDVHYDGEVYASDPGDAVYLPSGVPHGFRAGTEGPAAVYVLYEPGLERGFLDCGIPADVDAGELPTPPAGLDVSEKLTGMDVFDTEIVGTLPD